ncbi:MAG: hypothetical protein KDK59_06995 [Simkania sp.]|nr:hypothetical protein [Simkania sp.]MCB9092719.1 hypothetical protein [Halobacteriovoraceae bacterium]
MTIPIITASYTFCTKHVQLKTSDIMKGTGHTSASMVASYDKTSQEVNATEKIQLVN